MRSEFSCGFLVVEPVRESGFEYLTADDAEYAERFKAGARRSQWLSWREVVRRELGCGAKLDYAADGAPILTEPVGEVRFLSVSHTSESVAVLFSATRCGIDIEHLGRNFERVAKRYITPAEERLAEQIGDDWRAVIWCAKEAIFKYGRREGVDFLTDVVITAVDTNCCLLSAEFYGRPTPEVEYFRIDTEVLCRLTD